MKYTIVLVVFLAGCASKHPAPTVPEALDGVRSTVNVDARLLEGCENFTDIGQNVRPSDVLEQHANDVKALNCYKSKYGGLVKTIKDAFNIK